MKRRSLLAILIGAFVVLCLCAALGAALNPSNPSTPASAPQAAISAATSVATSAVVSEPTLPPTRLPSSATTAPPTKEPPNGYISADNVDFPWPFTALGGRVMCLNGNQIVFKPDGGDTYAINGMARGAAKNGTANYKDLDEIWLDNPNAAGTKIPIQPVIAIGLELCS